MIDTTLTHTLDRTVLIHADRDLVFRFFTDSARWAAWWGAGSSIEPRCGGRVFIRYPGGVEVSGEVVEINGSLKDRPDHVNSKPHETWMVKVKLAGPGEIASLMDAAAYEQLIQK